VWGRVVYFESDIHGTSEINPVIYGELENIKKLVESDIVSLLPASECTECIK
jgi:hypothetical protein